ncbi:MAG: FAD-binding oxidoreductase [Betaproteobacteria bacterium]|nr:FAD-binding oxidoreductase [Betaproteobacteria bacterium]
MARVAVIGAGIVGACCAFTLVREGHAVILIDPAEPGGPHAASHGNGAWFSPASVVPMSLPGLWRQLPGMLLSREGPVRLRPAALPGLAPWLLRFLRAGATPKRARAIAAALGPLLQGCADRHAQLAEAAGVPSLVVRRGLLYAYRDRAAFEREAFAWRLRREQGVVWHTAEGERLRALAPSLADGLRFGAHVPAGGHCTDPGAYVAALVAASERAGAQRLRGTALGLRLQDRRLRAVLTARGEVPCEVAVIAAGIAAGGLARQAGDRVPLAAERGYHAVFDAQGLPVPVPVMPADGRMANTPTRHGLRVAGQVEFAPAGAAPDWRRAELLARQARRLWPPLREAPLRSRWMGERPSTPDGLPVLGRASGCADVLHAFGHGHVGMAAAPASAQFLADLLAGRAPALDPEPYRAARFRLA